MSRRAKILDSLRPPQRHDGSWTSTGPLPSRAAKRSFGGLTKREREVASLIVQGKSNREIAEQLVVSERTDEKHIESILMKLGFNSRSQVAIWMAGMQITENSERGQDSV